MTTAIELPQRIRAAVCPLAALARAEGVTMIPDKCLGEHYGRFAAFGSLADCAVHISVAYTDCVEGAEHWRDKACELESDKDDLETEKDSLESRISELEGKIEDLEKERCEHE